MFPNPGNDIARIAQKRRTSSCRTAVLLMGDSPRVCSTSVLEEKKVHPDDESGRGGVCDGNAENDVTTTKGTISNDNNGTDAAAGPENNTAENGAATLPEREGRDIYIAKRRAERRARKKRGGASRKSDNGAEKACAKKRKTRRNDGRPRLPDRTPRECLPSQEEMLSLVVKGLPFAPGSPEQQEFEDAFREAVPDGCCFPGDSKLCRTPVSYIWQALKSVGYLRPQLDQLSSLS